MAGPVASCVSGYTNHTLMPEAARASGRSSCFEKMLALATLIADLRDSTTASCCQVRRAGRRFDMYRHGPPCRNVIEEGGQNQVAAWLPLSTCGNRRSHQRVVAALQTRELITTQLIRIFISCGPSVSQQQDQKGSQEKKRENRTENPTAITPRPLGGLTPTRAYQADHRGASDRSGSTAHVAGASAAGLRLSYDRLG